MCDKEQAGYQGFLQGCTKALSSLLYDCAAFCAVATDAGRRSHTDFLHTIYIDRTEAAAILDTHSHPGTTNCTAVF